MCAYSAIIRYFLFFMGLRDILDKNGFRFQKRFGQNFISDGNLLRSIVDKADLSDSDVVVEIGVGGATLTRALSERVKKVIGFEIDKNLIPVIAESLSGVENAEVVFKDFMKVDLQQLEKEIGENYCVVANLPYYITTPIIMRLVEESSLCKKIVVMVQKEVADRICAKPSTADYGSITVAVASVADAEIVADVNRKMFYPQPNVDSAVVKIDINRSKYEIKSRSALRNAIKTAFSSRRKTLANNLINTLKISRKTAEEILKSANVDVGVRGETLSVEEFIRLADAISQSKDNGEN